MVDQLKNGIVIVVLAILALFIGVIGVGQYLHTWYLLRRSKLDNNQK